LLRLSIAFVWLFTGLAVLHPYYREVGQEYLARLGLPDSVMVATCAFEVLLGLRVALGPASTWLMLLQVAMVAPHGHPRVPGAALAAAPVRPSDQERAAVGRGCDGLVAGA
jgi:hypothetical protein